MDEKGFWARERERERERESERGRETEREVGTEKNYFAVFENVLNIRRRFG